MAEAEKEETAEFAIESGCGQAIVGQIDFTVIVII